MDEYLEKCLKDIIDSPLRPDAEVRAIIEKENLRLQEYLIFSEKLFSCSTKQLQKEFTI